MQVPFFDLGALAREEAAEVHHCVQQVIDSGQFIGGDLVELFEHDFARYIGVDHVIGVGNGLDALRLALEAYGIGPGDEVIVPAFTYYATWLAVMQTGATPVPVDVDHLTANIDAGLIEEAVTEKTRAILAVHLYGQAADLSKLHQIAESRGLLLFEDAAQSHGARSAIGMTGSVGNATGFSFYPTKNLGAFGDAGAVATNDPDIARRVRSRRSYGQGQTKYDHVDFGWNSRLDPMQATILSLHLKKLDEWTRRRQYIAGVYRDSLSRHAPTSVVGPPDSASSVWHHFVLRSTQRDSVRAFLGDRGIATDIHYPYLITSVRPAFLALRSDDQTRLFPVAKGLSEQVLSLPIGPWMTNAQLEHVAHALAEIPEELLTN
jgi:dTDP-4-amino-4,6-dideoxygalactose transaminase